MVDHSAQADCAPFARRQGTIRLPMTNNFAESEISPADKNETNNVGSEIDDTVLHESTDLPLCSESRDMAVDDPTEEHDEQASALSFAENNARCRDFDKDLADADVPHESALFSGWKDKREHALALAYPLYLHLLASPPHVERLLAEPFFSPGEGARQRKPSAKKPALLAVQFVAKPQHEDERKTCSSYASLLEYAAMKHVSPDDFIVSTAAVTLKEAKIALRERSPSKVANRSSSSAKLLEEVFLLQIPLVDAPPLRIPFGPQLTDQSQAELMQLASALPDIGLPQLLRKLAELVENAQSAPT